MSRTRSQGEPRIGRRDFLEAGARHIGALAAFSLPYGPGIQQGNRPTAQHRKGRLSARPERPSEPLTPGRHPLGIGGEQGGTQRDGVIYVPAKYSSASPAPLVLMLHGAGGRAAGGLRPFEGLADERGFVLLAPDSRAMSWDIRWGSFGPDVAFIDRALARVFRACAIDPARMAVEGFSDGASYALALGLANGDLFRRIVAFSPGFLALPEAVGKPGVFISHGTRDEVLDIDQSSRSIVPRLRRAGYEVQYREFEGGHRVPPAIASEAATWLVAG